MNGKWLKLGMVATVVALAGALALSTTAFAQAGTPAAGPRGGGNGMGAGVRGAWGGPGNSLVTVAAEAMEMERVELVAELNAGQTIADVAAARGVVLDTIVDAMVAPRAAWLSQAVAAERLTQAQADTMLATMQAQVLAQLSAPHTPYGSGLGGGMGFVDADGDGVCDTGGGTMPGANRGGRGGR